MKNKKMLFVLAPGVLFVWGMIIYRIVVSVGGDDTNPLQNAGIITDNKNEILNDTFSINPDYRDPFLGKTIIKKESTTKTSLPVINKIKPVITTTVWPVIVYEGMIKNQKSNKQMVLIKVNGQSSAIKTGDVINGIELISVFKDSIEMALGKEKKFFKK